MTDKRAAEIFEQLKKNMRAAGNYWGFERHMVVHDHEGNPTCTWLNHPKNGGRGELLNLRFSLDELEDYGTSVLFLIDRMKKYMRPAA